MKQLVLLVIFVAVGTTLSGCVSTGPALFASCSNHRIHSCSVVRHPLRVDQTRCGLV